MLWPIVAILGLGLGIYSIYFGIRYGLIQKEMPRNYWRNTQYTGSAAVRQGWLYIVSGSVSLLILLLGLMRFGFYAEEHLKAKTYTYDPASQVA